MTGRDWNEGWLPPVLGLIDLSPEVPSGGHGVDRARHDLRGASAILLVECFRFEQLGVREDDSELVVEAMKQQSQVFHGARRHQARVRSSDSQTVSIAGWSV